MFLLFSDGLLAHEVSERWSIKKIRSCSWLAHQSFPKEYDPFATNLSDYWVSRNETKISTASSIEHETYLRLKKLGITSELLHAKNQHSDDKHFSNRDNINGTYRILFHHLQKQSNPLERDDLYDNENNEDGETRERRRSRQHLTQSQTQGARVCTIL